MKTESNPNSQPTTEPKLEASFSMLIMSMASSALMAMGLTPDPQTGKSEADKPMAKFNIDLLVNLKDKTKNNLTPDEQGLLDHILQDLQMKFIQLK
ncbi:MAG: DUF1844 domain-containing protein [Bdellovibrionaceae bacterium]|nr:DUF1844 domain-containing protein [Bdellovibrio sp.]